MTIILIIIANSIKHGGRCIAGKTLDNNWIRLVSDEHGSELTEQQDVYTNPYGQYHHVRPLQKIKMKIGKNVPLAHQPENMLIDDSNEWQQDFNISIADLNNYIDYPENIWGNDNRVNNHEILAGNILIAQSLYLLKITNAKLYSSENEKPRLHFFYKNMEYDFPVTDPHHNLKIDTPYSELIACISLGEPYKDYCYKIVASIFN